MPTNHKPRTTNHVIETPASGGADLAIVRHPQPPQMRKPIATDHLPCVCKNLKFPGSCATTEPCLSHNLQASGASVLQPRRSTLAKWYDRCLETSVTFREILRHQPCSFNGLSYMHTPPPIFSKNPPYGTLKVAENEKPA